MHACRKRQRLHPSLENASGAIFHLPENYLAKAFPIKASDHSEVSQTTQYVCHRKRCQKLRSVFTGSGQASAEPLGNLSD